MNNTTIEWTEHTWNPVTGCTQISPGCDNCYAKRITEQSKKVYPKGFEITLRPHRLDEPVKWRKPSFIFVNSMSDLFHRDIPSDYLTMIWHIMCRADWHIYQILTKRPHRMAHIVSSRGLPTPPHIWLGVSVENQTFGDNRIPPLLSIPAQVRWLSCEPLLGPLNLTPYLPHLQWVVDGGESGPRRRPANPDWFRSIRDQCKAANIPYFHKQGNTFRPGYDRLLDGRTWEEYPGMKGDIQ